MIGRQEVNSQSTTSHPAKCVASLGAAQPYAFQREHADPWAADYPPLVLDRMRVVHSAAFRRLQFKTQAFVKPDSDHFRTRMTHTLEVANQARRLALQLGLNENLAEVVALAHDLGHPPFGHAGERALDECLKDQGGFEHNANSLRVVEYLEHPYPEFRGLNLTRIVRECLAKHATTFDRPGAHSLQDGRPAPLEGQVVALADRLTYCMHDLQDGLYAGWLRFEDLAEARLWSEAYAGQPPDADPNWLRRLRPTIDAMARRLAGALQVAGAAVRLTADAETLLSELQGVLKRRVYQHPRLLAEDEQAIRVVRELFAAYEQNSAELPTRFQERIREQGLPRVICDYVSGMTDRFCADEHRRLAPLGQ